MMFKWIKKDPLVHWLAIILTPLFIILLIISGSIIYGVITIFDPNYEEFGPFITLYKSKDCAEPKKPQYGNCLVYGYGPSIYKNNPPTLYQEIEIVTAGVKGRFEGIDFNPLNASQWECSVDGIIISNIQEKVQDKKTYKCWPKE